MANPSMAAGGGVPWAEGVRAVGAQIRNRLRVAPVDRRWLWRRPEGRAASDAVRLWSDRLRAFLQRDKHKQQGPDQQQQGPDAPAAARPSSSALRFYRKKVGKEVNGVEDSVIFRSLQALAVPLIGNACHVFMHGLNSVQIYGAEKLQQALQERPKDKPLLTVSNHVAAMDDPFVIASLLPPSVMLEAQKLRWTLCATDRCFTNPVLSTFFRSVKVLPVNRGEGIYQKGMDMALSKLNNGGWVHIFPEGSRSKDGGKTIAPAKRGVGRLVMDADSLPVVVPFVHTGMQDIMPVGKRIPRTGKRVIVVVGDPINFDDLMAENSNDSQHISRGDLYDKVTERIGQHLQQLKVEVDRLAAEQKTELQNHYMADTVNDGYKGTQIIDDSHDQDTTDLNKCISFITKNPPGPDNSNLRILVLGALGGRFDHEMGNINVLYRFSNTRIILLSDDSSIFLLPRTHNHEIRIERSVEGPHCGLIPVGAPSSSSTTTGLRWNLDNTSMNFGGLLSTSNIVEEEIVTVTSDSDLIWTISLRKHT